MGKLKERLIAVDEGFARLRQLKSEISERFIEIGGICLYLRQHDVSVDVLAAHLEMSKRKVYHLIEIYQAVEDGLMTRNQASAMGWTKASALCRVEKGSTNVKKLIRLSGKLSIGTLQKVIKTGDSAPSERIMRTLALDGPQAAEFDAALEMMGYIAHARDNQISREDALMAVVRAGVKALSKLKVKKAA